MSLFFGFPVILSSQSIPEHISDKPLYDFPDELANDQVIDLVSVVKPYSRSYIAEKLLDADGQRTRLSTRQQVILDMYLCNFYYM